MLPKTNCVVTARSSLSNWSNSVPPSSNQPTSNWCSRRNWPRSLCWQPGLARDRNNVSCDPFEYRARWKPICAGSFPDATRPMRRRRPRITGDQAAALKALREDWIWISSEKDVPAPMDESKGRHRLAGKIAGSRDGVNDSQSEATGRPAQGASIRRSNIANEIKYKADVVQGIRRDTGKSNVCRRNSTRCLEPAGQCRPCDG